jgi:hypothetical protein
VVLETGCLLHEKAEEALSKWLHAFLRRLQLAYDLKENTPFGPC